MPRLRLVLASEGLLARSVPQQLYLLAVRLLGEAAGRLSSTHRRMIAYGLDEVLAVLRGSVEPPVSEVVEALRRLADSLVFHPLNLPLIEAVLALLDWASDGEQAHLERAASLLGGGE